MTYSEYIKTCTYVDSSLPFPLHPLHPIPTSPRHFRRHSRRTPGCKSASSRAPTPSIQHEKERKTHGENSFRKRGLVSRMPTMPRSARTTKNGIIHETANFFSKITYLTGQTSSKMSTPGTDARTHGQAQQWHRHYRDEET